MSLSFGRLALAGAIGYNTFMAEKENDANWTYNSEGAEAPSGENKPAKAKTPRSVTWTASEFIHHSKGPNWYLAFFGGIAVIAALVFLFTRDYISTVVIALAGIIFAVLARRKPDQLTYELNDMGIQIGPKFYEYTNFKSFAIGEEGAVRSIELMPLKRFMPDISIYFPPEQEAAIINILVLHLPHDHQEVKAVDKLARRLRF